MSAFTGTDADLLVAIGKVTKAAANGLATCLYIAEASWLTSIPARTANTNTIATDITMDSGKVFISWYIGEDESVFSSSAIGAQGALSHENALTVFIPGHRDLVEAFLNNNINNEFVIIAPDREGNLRVIGESYSPAFVVSDSLEVINSNEKEGYTFMFKARGKIAANYTGAIPLT